jgi:hypothetical protein
VLCIALLSRILQAYDGGAVLISREDRALALQKAKAAGASWSRGDSSVHNGNWSEARHLLHLSEE